MGVAASGVTHRRASAVEPVTTTVGHPGEFLHVDVRQLTRPAGLDPADHSPGWSVAARAREPWSCPVPFFAIKVTHYPSVAPSCDAKPFGRSIGGSLCDRSDLGIGGIEACSVEIGDGGARCRLGEGTRDGPGRAQRHRCDLGSNRARRRVPNCTAQRRRRRGP
jgi:hypothetical protein